MESIKNAADPDSMLLVLSERDDTHANTHKIPSPSMQPLAVELLAQIFQLCLPPNFRDCQPVSARAPLLLCHICSRWREIAMNTPALWTSLAIVIFPGTRIDVSGYSEAARHWFQRAGTMLVSLKLANGPYPDDSNANDLIRLVLLPHVHRIRELDISFLPVNQPLGLSPKSVDYSALPILYYACLESLAVYLEFSREPGDSLPVVMSQTTPRLRRVKLINVDQDIDLPWAQLTHLNIADLRDSSLITLLAQCISLTHGTFSIHQSSSGGEDIGGEDNAVAPSGSIILPNLITFNLRFSDYAALAKTFRRFRFPALVQMTITHPRFWNLSNETGYLCAQFREIRRLTFHGEIMIDGILGVAKDASAVSRFKVASGDHHGPLFHALTIADGREHLLPCLEDLSIWCSARNAERFDLEQFVGMLRSRGPQGLTNSFPPLRRVKVKVPAGTVGWNLRRAIETAVRESFPVGAPRLIFQ